MKRQGWPQRTAGLWVIMAGLHGAMAVALGAYAAHGMADQSADILSLMEKATRYQMLHAVVLLVATGLSVSKRARRAGGLWFMAAAGLFALGIPLFCGALYGIALAGWPLGFIAPYGGSAMIGGWLFLTMGGRSMVQTIGTRQ